MITDKQLFKLRRIAEAGAIKLKIRHADDRQTFLKEKVFNISLKLNASLTALAELRSNVNDRDLKRKQVVLDSSMAEVLLDVIIVCMMSDINLDSFFEKSQARAAHFARRSTLL